MVWILMFWGALTFAAEYTITPDMTPEEIYTMIESAGAGDTVWIHPGTYQVRIYLSNSGTMENPVVIKGTDPNNRPVFDYTGRDAAQWPGSDSGKIHRWAWQIQADHIIIENLVIQGAVHRSSVSSSAGIFMGPETIYKEPTPPSTIPENITLRNLLMRDNDEGLQGTANNVLVEKCEIFGNGDPTASRPRHNVYLQGGSAVFRFCKIHSPTWGANLTLRTREARIEYSDIGPWGEGASHGIQLLTDKASSKCGQSYQQTLTMIGNTISGIRQGDKSMSKLVYLGNTNNYAGNRMRLNMYYNTFEGEKGNRGNIVQLHPGSGQEKMEVYFYNNIFLNNTRPVRYTSGSINDAVYGGDIRNNWFPEADYTAWSGIMSNNVFGGSPDTARVNAANPSLGETPSYEPLGTPRKSALSLGAMEENITFDESTISARLECLFDNLESAFPQYFSPPSAQTEYFEIDGHPFRYRSYPLTVSFLVMYLDRIFCHGPFTDYQWSNEGSSYQVFKKFGCW